MVVDERSRHELSRRLEEVLGTEAATTLIEHLPPVGWAEVVTKHDLAALEQWMELRFARVHDRFALIDDRFDRIEERLNGLEERFNRLGCRFDGVNDRIKATTSDLRATFEHELRSQTTTMVFGLVTVVLTMAALAFALVRFA
jgi:transcriptional regulator NrdR family protein